MRHVLHPESLSACHHQPPAPPSNDPARTVLAVCVGLTLFLLVWKLSAPAVAAVLTAGLTVALRHLLSPPKDGGSRPSGG